MRSWLVTWIEEPTSAWVVRPQGTRAEDGTLFDDVGPFTDRFAVACAARRAMRGGIGRYDNVYVDGPGWDSGSDSYGPGEEG